MEEKYIKDFVIALVILLILAFAIKDYYLYKISNDVPDESIHKKIALSEGLLGKIENIEQSINDRKQFVFSVAKDPLEQNLIVRTQKDLEKQWREEVESMVRLESTIIPDIGDKLATVSYQGLTKNYKIGDEFVKGKIIDILYGEILYSYQGTTASLRTEKIPPKPVEISTKKSKKSREYNW
ncbi:MAG TPA: hypothetical protein ENL20_06985 [Candidatus Cloacimonetes bacterium]|nr:hypothetical protein [Candidatus Cloacimonadota bacterium]